MLIILSHGKVFPQLFGTGALQSTSPESNFWNPDFASNHHFKKEDDLAKSSKEQNNSQVVSSMWFLYVFVSLAIAWCFTDANFESMGLLFDLFTLKWINIGPENHHVLAQTNLPTPICQVYVRLLEGIPIASSHVCRKPSPGQGMVKSVNHWAGMSRSRFRWLVISLWISLWISLVNSD